MSNSKQFDADQAVERVLAGLRSVDPLPGMEERILLAAENAEAPRATWAGRLRRSVRAFAGNVSGWPWALALGTGGLAILLIGIGVHDRWAKGRESQAHVHSAGRSGSNHGSSPKALVQARGPADADEPAEGKATEEARHALVAVTSRNPARSRTRAATLDERALAEAREPSHPAPEAPLTEQEKLLLRIVHTGDPLLIAVLNPEVRARADAKWQAEFEQFVNQGIRGDRE